MKIKLKMSREQAAHNIKKALERELPVDDISAQFQDDGIIRLSGETEKSAVEALLDRYHKRLSGGAALLLSALPKRIRLDLTFKVDLKQGELFVSPVSAYLGKIPLPAGVIPQSSLLALNRSLNGAVEKRGGKIEDFSIQDGALYLIARVPDTENPQG